MLSSANLQLIAILTMLIDHVGAYILHNALPARAIGRLAMPLFCLMLSEGFLHTRGRHLRYFGRLMVFAFISQIAFDLVHYVASGGTLMELPGELASGALSAKTSLNVMFTLAFGFVAMGIFEYLSWHWDCLLILPILLILAEYLKMDYGAYGILMILGFYLPSKFFPGEEKRPSRLIVTALLFFGATLLYVSIHNNPMQLFALPAIVPIFAYNGKLGKRLPKWFGYIFYPAHLLVIAIICLIINAAA